jgi:hypothetical protein
VTCAALLPTFMSAARASLERDRPAFALLAPEAAYTLLRTSVQEADLTAPLRYFEVDLLRISKKKVKVIAQHEELRVLIAGGADKLDAVTLVQTMGAAQCASVSHAAEWLAPLCISVLMPRLC